MLGGMCFGGPRRRACLACFGHRRLALKMILDQFETHFQGCKEDEFGLEVGDGKVKSMWLEAK